MTGGLAPPLRTHQSEGIVRVPPIQGRGPEMSLKEAATAVRENAHAPYSGFKVGAALRASSGKVYAGCNVENASYGLTICAERNAIFAAIARGLTPMALAVSCPDASSDSPNAYKMPCGACRQVIAEFMGDDAPVEVDAVGNFTVGNLLPMAFRI